MMKKINILLIIIVILLLFSGCIKPDASNLKFYVISREFLTQDLSDNQVVAAVNKNGRLVFDGDDIKGYNWETHTVFLKENSVTSHGAVTNDTGGSAIFKVDDTFAFVITINNKLIYYGGFIQGTKNPAVPLQPYINDISSTEFKIEFDSKYASKTDSRNNNKFYSFLNKLGLLSAKIN